MHSIAAVRLVHCTSDYQEIAETQKTSAISGSTTSYKESECITDSDIDIEGMFKIGNCS